MKDLITIIIPVYKVEKFIRECIESVINQTYSNLEIILVDDGSPDKSGEICDEYAKKDSRIKVIHKENGGVSSARNEGIKWINGSYFAFLDSDDILDKQYIETLHNQIIKDDSDICICKTNEFINSKELPAIVNNGIIKKFNFEKNDIESSISTIMNDYYGSGVITKLYRKIGNIPTFESISIGEDLLFNIDYMHNVTNVIILDYNGYFYRTNEGSLTRSIQRQLFEDLEKIIKKRNWNYGIYSVYCFRIYNEQIFNIYVNDRVKIKYYIKKIKNLQFLKKMISDKQSVKKIICLTKRKKIYIKFITFLIRNNMYNCASALEILKYKFKK